MISIQQKSSLASTARIPDHHNIHIDNRHIQFHHKLGKFLNCYNIRIRFLCRIDSIQSAYLRIDQ